MVEKMGMINIVGNMNELEFIMRDIVAYGMIHPVDAMSEINESNFTLCMLEENVDEIVNLCEINAYEPKGLYKQIDRKLECLMERLKIDKEVSDQAKLENYDFNDVINNVEVVHNKFLQLTEEMDALYIEKKKLDALLVLNVIDEVDISLKALDEMVYFNYRIGILKKEDRIKLSLNYENISAAVLHIGTYGGDEVYLVVSPKELELETQRILNSVYFRDVEIIKEYLDFPYVALEKIQNRLQFIKLELEERQREIDSFSEKFGSFLKESYAQLLMEIATDGLKRKIAFTRSYFYFSGWIPLRYKAQIDTFFRGKYGASIILTFEEPNEIDSKATPPTKLKNNQLLKPFELLVNMYGIPSYDEVDPTLFLGLTYMFLFGAMFGDLGQGLVLFISGWLWSRKSKNHLSAGILTRLGLSSMVFGFLYDSFFGYEHLISYAVGTIIGHEQSEGIFLRPIENINTVLTMSIVLGIFLLLISFGYSIFNKLKRRDIKEGILGRNGLAGLMLYMMLIIFGLKAFIPTLEVPETGMKIGILIMIMSIVFREPLSNLILKHRPLYHESATEYYVESSFDILETFLSMLSNSVSFIRVGAFALNHVGLFIAFHTMADIIGGAMGNVAMFIVGNLMVIFLEGLIVFIQGLRLVYYEMFSKYYTGDGVEFNPVKLG